MMKNEIVTVLSEANVITDCVDVTFKFVGVNEKVFILKDGNDDIYNFWIGTAELNDNVLVATDYDTDEEITFVLS